LLDAILQRVVFPASPRAAALYYQCAGPEQSVQLPPRVIDGRTLELPPGVTVHTRTYFNGFFEAPWRQFTQVGQLVLRLTVSGRALVTLRRCSAETGDHPLESRLVEGDGREVEMEVPSSGSYFRENAILYVTVAALSPVTVRNAAWVARQVEPKPVRFALGMCTFNREEELIRNIAALQADPDLPERVGRIIVVDQGKRPVRNHPRYPSVAGQRPLPVQLVEQGNFGGTGGFTRCLIEAASLPSVTHVLLMDDDALVEPESVFRSAAFLSLARGEVVLAGQMLDLIRPTQLVEAGGAVLPRRLYLLTPAPSGLDLTRPEGLLKLSAPRALDYGSWFFCAVSKPALENVGLPMPLFIRGDDAEFGCRLTAAGLPIVTLPGVAVWHHPWYARERGWQTYYNLRNTLILCAVHFPTSRWARFLSVFRRVIGSLLLRDYYAAWLSIEALRAYVKGPEVLERDPRETHQRLLDAGRELAPATLPRLRPLPAVQPPRRPRTWLGKLLGLARALLVNLVRRSPAPDARPAGALPAEGEHWHSLRPYDVVAVDDPYRCEYVVLRRSRARFLSLLWQGLRVSLAVLFRHRSVERSWRQSLPGLTSPAAWRRLLQLPAQEPSDSAGPQGRPPLAA
jgi:galactofuranosylgalactofuranosylrhamnosyl-N-acetylglucosaminyl-diphospho-decaprenol beta-1,5/1,6-galactofuranosyltransferase